MTLGKFLSLSVPLSSFLSWWEQHSGSRRTNISTISGSETNEKCPQITSNYNKFLTKTCSEDTHLPRVSSWGHHPFPRWQCSGQARRNQSPWGICQPYLQAAGQAKEGVHAKFQVEKIQRQKAEQVHLKSQWHHRGLDTEPQG